MSTRRKPPGRDPRPQERIRIEANRRYHREIPAPPPGQHLWAVLGIWRVAEPTAERFLLDLENLLTLEGPGCWVCEQPWSAELAATTCPGEVEDDPKGES